MLAWLLIEFVINYYFSLSPILIENNKLIENVSVTICVTEFVISYFL